MRRTLDIFKSETIGASLLSPYTRSCDGSGMSLVIHKIVIVVTLMLAVVAGSADRAFADGSFSPSLASTLSILPHRTGDVTSENRPEEPEGSGIAVLKGGYIATAAHVLTGAEAVHVRFFDGRILPARIVGQDRFTDIALLQIDEAVEPFPVAARTTMGQRVCAIGNQFGLGLSLSCGVVSAVHRSNAGFNPIEDFVQTDAVVNPGASGGALVNENGQLVGMLSGIFTKNSDADVGVNFAVHAPFLMRVVEDLKAHGRVKRAKSGMVVQPLTLSERATRTGVRVLRVSPDKAADRVGLSPDDLIVAMTGRKIRHPSDVSAIVYSHRPGETITLERERDGQIDLVHLTLD